MKTRLRKAAVLFLVFVLAVTMSVPVFAATNPLPATAALEVEGDRLLGREVIAIRVFDIDVATSDDKGIDNFVDPMDVVSYALAGGDTEADSPWLEAFYQPNVVALLTAYGAKLDVPVVIDNPVEDITPQLIQDYMMTLSSDPTKRMDIDVLADELQMWVLDHDPVVTAMAGTVYFTATAEGNADTAVNPTARGIATFDDPLLPTGYYLVFPEGAPQAGEGNSTLRGTNAMLVHVPGSLTLKSAYPSMDKTVQMTMPDDPLTVADESASPVFVDSGGAQIGDTLTFKLTSVANVTSDYTAYYFAFTDTMSAGLTLTGTPVVKVEGYLQEEGLFGSYTQEDGNYPLLPAPKTVSWVFKDLLKAEIADGVTLGATAASKDGSVLVEVTYTAIVNANALVFNEANPNSATVEFSTTYDGGGHGKSTDTTNVYTYAVTIDKRDEINAPLPGAEFILSKDDALAYTRPANDVPLQDFDDPVYSKVIPLAYTDRLITYNIFDLLDLTEPELNTGEYLVMPYTLEAMVDVRVAYLDLSAQDDPLFPIPSMHDKRNSNLLTINGLGAGTYYLYETKTPPLPGFAAGTTDPNERYPAAGPFELVIAPTMEGGQPNFGKPIFSIDGQVVDPDAGSVITVINAVNSILPETGGMGTVGLTILGVAVIAGGVIFTNRRNRKNKTQ